MIAQDLFVTGLTRAQSRAFVIASDRALDIAVNRRRIQSNPGTLKAALVQP